jgi:4-deoxy-L-threo-5-hexosulose-uronate ketol-isomerase
MNQGGKVMEVRNAIHPQDFENYTTDKIRKEFLVKNLFVPGELALTYSYYDRMIVGGACPNEPLSLAAGKEIGSDYFLARREMGIINVGKKGAVAVDGEKYIIDTTDGLYVGMGSKEVVFTSEDNDRPAHFYLLSGPAHR